MSWGSRRLFSALAIGCSALAASSAWAATVEPGYGDLTINQGQGFKPIQSGLNANVGDSVMVGSGRQCNYRLRRRLQGPGPTGRSRHHRAALALRLRFLCRRHGAEGTTPRCRDHPNRLCQFNPVFWAIWLGGVGFLTYEIVRSSSHHETTPSPASP